MGTLRKVSFVMNVVGVWKNVEKVETGNWVKKLADQPKMWH